MVDAQKVTQALEAKGVSSQCPRCNQNRWDSIDQYAQFSMSATTSDVTIGGATIPAVGLACANCGFLTWHAAATLGL